MEERPYSYFWWCEFFWGPWVSFVATEESSVKVTKVVSKIIVSNFYLLLNSVKWPYYQKHVNDITLNHITLLSDVNAWSIHSNFVWHESFLESKFPGNLAQYDYGNFCVRGYLPLIERIMLLWKWAFLLNGTDV